MPVSDDLLESGNHAAGDMPRPDHPTEPDDASWTFETALARLEEIVAILENQDAPLDESVSLYEEGVRLKSYCEERLEQARMTIEHITPPTAPPVAPPVQTAE